MQFLFVALKSTSSGSSQPDSFSALQALIPTRQGIGDLGALADITYPIVWRENGDWVKFIDEYGYGYGGPDSPAWPGIAIIDQAGKFVGVRAYPGGNWGSIHTQVDWVVRTVDGALGGRQPVDVALALDRSGTMGQLPPSGGTAPKIDILKDAVGVLFDVWEANAVSGDRVGIVDFDSTVNTYTESGTGASLVPLASNAVAVRSYVNGLGTGGWTCMGGAVAKSLAALQSIRRHVILFSDGMQNYNPVLADVDPYHIRILDVAPANAGQYSLVEGIYGDSGVPPVPGQDLSGFHTPIHTIGVGLSGEPWSTLMSRVASETTGEHFETPSPQADLQGFYINALLQSFAGGGSTPQLLRHAHGTFDLQSGQAIDECWVNGTARWLTLVLSWEGNPDRNQLFGNLEAPDGTLIEIRSRTRSSARRCVTSMPLPTHHYQRLVSQVGRWRLHIVGTASGPTAYQVFWIVDDRRIHLDVARVPGVCRVNDILELKVRLICDGEPLPVARYQEGTLHWAAPTIDLERFLDGYRVDPAKIAYVEKMLGTTRVSDRQLKRLALSLDKEAVAHCTHVDVQALSFIPQRGGLEKRVRLSKPGLNRLQLSVKGLDSQGHQTVRERSLHVWVREAGDR